MDLRCPICNGADLKKLSLAYQEGRFQVDTRTRLRGVVVGEGGPDVVVGRATTRGIQQTELSKDLSPPAKRSYLKLVLWSAFVSLVAQPADVFRLVLGHGMSMVVVGVVIGLAISAFLTQKVNGLLYGIGKFDAPSFLATATILLAVALAACWLPTRRAMRLDPMVALRYE